MVGSACCYNSNFTWSAWGACDQGIKREIGSVGPLLEVARVGPVGRGTGKEAVPVDRLYGGVTKGPLLESVNKKRPDKGAAQRHLGAAGGKEDSHRMFVIKDLLGWLKEFGKWGPPVVLGDSFERATAVAREGSCAGRDYEKNLELAALNEDDAERLQELLLSLRCKEVLDQKLERRKCADRNYRQ
ncbi:hypothetical protein F0562_010722 [Nyssa sinensis]|uniref:Uncharacterized protein n=1 Tax=Nyssa sinensis TaxID=561372 RepID=A0A5J5A1X5_9ASTE|nr:hypothetical protein F0562_010722 [Nyssa sinensis]